VVDRSKSALGTLGGATGAAAFRARNGPLGTKEAAFMTQRRLGVFVAAGMLLTLAAFTPVSAATTAPGIQVISDSSLKALSATQGGAQVLPTSRTVPHWWGSTVDPENGVT
jgi:hypothetical protein